VFLASQSKVVRKIICLFIGGFLVKVPVSDFQAGRIPSWLRKLAGHHFSQWFHGYSCKEFSSQYFIVALPDDSELFMGEVLALPVLFILSSALVGLREMEDLLFN
jgi:hypothetical protein